MSLTSLHLLSTRCIERCGRQSGQNREEIHVPMLYLEAGCEVDSILLLVNADLYRSAASYAYGRTT